jgi:hypothetical protein
MSFTLSAFVDRWPFLYHFTSVENVENIQSTRTLHCAAELASQSGICMPPEKRQEALRVGTSTNSIWLQNQKPLYEKNISFEDGWQMQQLIDCLNGFVFFLARQRRQPKRVRHPPPPRKSLAY